MLQIAWRLVHVSLEELATAGAQNADPEERRMSIWQLLNWPLRLVLWLIRGVHRWWVTNRRDEGPWPGGSSGR